MKAHRIIWWTVAMAFATIGILASAILWSVVTMLIIFGCTGLVAAAIIMVAQDGESSRRRQATDITRKALLSGFSTAGLLGLAALIGISVLAVLALMAASSPLAVGYCRRNQAASASEDAAVEERQAKVETRPRQREPAKPMPRRPAPIPIEIGASHLSDAALCRAWRRSYWALKDATSAGERLRIVRARESYLDEFERRYPQGVVDWLESGAKPADDPGMYLTTTVVRKSRVSEDSAAASLRTGTPEQSAADEGTMMAGNTDAGLVPLKDTDMVVAGQDADVRGRTVVDRTGEDIGEIDGLVVDTDEAKVRFLQVGSGGFLGIGEKKQLIPVDAVTRVEEDKVAVDKDREHVAAAPVYDPELKHDPDRGYYEGIYSHYGYEPFWAPGYMYPRYPYYTP